MLSWQRKKCKIHAFSENRDQNLNLMKIGRIDNLNVDGEKTSAWALRSVHTVTLRWRTLKSRSHYTVGEMQESRSPKLVDFKDIIISLFTQLYQFQYSN